MRRSLILVVVLALLAFGLPIAVLPTAAQDEPVELLFRQFDPPTEIGGLQQAVDAWNEGHPNILVRLETVPLAEAQNQYVREVQAGGGPDIQHLAFVWTRDLGRSGLLMPLDELLQASPPGDGIEDFLATDLAQLDGVTYGLPWTVDTNAIAYRPDLLRTAGVDAFPDTWDQFLTVAEQLTVDSDDDGRTDQYGFCFPAGSGPDGTMWFIANYYLWSNGKFFVQDDGAGSWEVGVTAEDVAGAITYFDAFFERGVTPRSLIAVNSTGDPEIVGGLGRGDCAMTFLTPQTFRAAQEQSEEPLRTAPIPRGSVNRISHLGGRTLGINPNTEHAGEAWEFVKYLASADVFGFYDQYPAQRSLLDALTFPEGEEGYVEMLPLAITFERYISSPARVSSMWEATNRQFGAVYSGQRSPAEAGDDLVAELAELLARGPE